MIRKLPQDVINQIAAGEIVQRPYSAVKETIENSIDARATQIAVHLKNGGLDMIRIVDNGSGVREADFPLLCERYATSKIETANDLNSLTSFGFRGEALASISFVCDLKINSKRRENEIGWSGEFKDSRMINLAKSGAVLDGTEIIIQNLFNALDSRRDGINKLEEKKSILLLIQSYSMRFQDRQFRLFIDGSCEFTSIDRETTIKSLIKCNVINYTFKDDGYDFKSDIAFTKLSALKLKREFILFINGRLVESDSLKRSINFAYSKHYQIIHDDVGGFFVYLSIELNPKHVDQNVHPNKKEVRFINETEIIQIIQDTLYKALESDNHHHKSIQNTKFKESLENQLQQKQKLRVDPKLQTLEQVFNKVKTIKVDYFQELAQYNDIPTKQLYNQMVFVGYLGGQQVVAQFNNSLILMNVVPLLFNYYLFHLNQRTFRFNIKLNSIDQDELNQLGFECVGDHQYLAPCSQLLADQLPNYPLIHKARLIAEELSLRDHTAEQIRDIIPRLKDNIALPQEYQTLVCLGDLYHIFERC